VSITVYGPPSETDIEQQVSILENVVTRHLSGILIAASSSDAPADAIAQDRIAVMHKGRIMGIVDKGEATQELLLRLASGLPA
jgi:ABC-type sugar transport system ATPase subunit